MPLEPFRTRTTCRTLFSRLLFATALIGLAGCEPEVGSERWCKAMAEKPKGDWTANEALDYAEHCLID
jgi:hypothetical protein